MQGRLILISATPGTHYRSQLFINSYHYNYTVLL